MAATGLPSLSQIQSWDTEHLDAAATQWTTTAQTWENAFTAVHQEAQAPGGTAWNGEAAEAAILRTGTDRLKVLGAVDSLHSAATAARTGASELQVARQLAIGAVSQAEASGFAVGEDLSVTSQYTGGPPAVQAARRAQAQTLAADIRSRAAALAALDQQVACQITTAAAGVNGIEFDDAPMLPDRQDGRKRLESPEALDYHTWKQSPGASPTPEPGTGGAPDPVTRLGLPNYAPGTLSNAEARTVYLQGEQRMRQLNDQLAQQGVSIEERARQMSDMRNSLRSWARVLMTDRALADQLNADEPNMAFEQLIAKNQAKGLTGDDVYKAIIDSSVGSRGSVNRGLGIDPAKLPDLPPVRAPAEAPPTTGGPPVRPPPEPPPVVPGGAVPPGGPHLVAPPHSHHGEPTLGANDPQTYDG
jgi:hypothetical protein